MTTKPASASSTPRRFARVRKDPEATQKAPASAEKTIAADSMAASFVLAVRVILAVFNGKSLNEALTAIAKEPMRAAAQDIAYGVLRQYGKGDGILAQLLQRPLSHEETRILLLAALYRLDTRSDSDHTVVNQAVAASGELSGDVFKGFVNGVLRNYLRKKETLIAALEKDEVAKYQHPRWWLNKIQRSYPKQWQEIVGAANLPPPMTLRVNQRKGTRDSYLSKLAEAGIEARPLGLQGIRLKTPVAVEKLPGFFEGLASVQDAGAQRAAEILAPHAGDRVLDACAAPGGKTAHLLESADIALTAIDVDANRIRRIEENLTRLQLSATVLAADTSSLTPWWDQQPFDAILADVPCSASGVIRRHPDIKLLRRESDIRPLCHTQAKILDELWQALKPGGKLLYATCSIFPEENSGQIDAFLVRQPDSRLLSSEQLLPHEDHDGFYYALLGKNQ